MTIYAPAPAAGDALSAYEALAPAYDVLAADYAHDRWLDAIVDVARRYGVEGRRVLDVACGTGRSFVPLLERGWDVTALDLSPSMVERARAAAGGRAEVLVADMRALDALGEFDLLTCLDDAINYLLDAEDVGAALAGFARNLGEDGIAVWDVNTLRAQRSAFSNDWIRDAGETVITWNGRSGADVEPGGVFEAAVDVWLEAGDGWSRSRGVHTQRHWPVATLTRLASEAGLEVVATLGQRPGAQLDDRGSEDEHNKILFVARRA